ncbi:MAG TPA: ABC transporter substrate-binding protein, partial [Dehalococcoidales bacterium]|nr:ABC transporter substrate-binding protein [Dehalococcoidales bacterium]
TAAGTVTNWDGITYTPYTGKFDRTLTIYAVVPLSGTAATYGLSIKLGFDQAVADMNDMGGIMVGGSRYKVAVSYIDGKLDTATTIAAFQQVVLQYNAKFVINDTTAMIMATEDFLAQNNVFDFAQTIGQPKNMGAKWPLQFMNGLDVADFGPCTYYGYLASAMGVKTIAVVNQDADNGHLFDGFITNDVSAFNIPVTLIDHQFYTPGTQDYTPLINKLMAEKPDCIDITSATPAELALFSKQARGAGFKGVIADLSSQGDPAIAWNVAGAASTGIVTIGFVGQDPTPLYTAWRQMIEKKTGQTMFVSVPYTYDEGLQWLMAINSTNSFDPYKVAAAFQDWKWNGLYGSMQFHGDEPGSLIGLKRVIDVNQPMIKFTTNGAAEWVVRLGYSGVPLK